ncbi:MAG: glycosyltransferase family 2 protein [Chloroflexota bacterium]
MIVIGGFISFALLIMWLTAVSNFLFFPRLKPPRSLPSQPLVSILIPARNEEAVIGKTVAAILQQSYVNFELLILNDQSEDNTLQQIQEVTQNDERVWVINGRSLPKRWLGKNWACHQLSQHAKGELLLFIDADVTLAPTALSALVNFQAAHQSDLLTIWPTQKTESWGERLVVPQMALAILAYLPILPVHYLTLPAFAAANGQCLLFTNIGYAQSGGHEAVKDNVVEDVELARRIKQAKRRLRMADGNRLISCRMYQSWVDVQAGFAKNILAGHANSVPFLTLSTLFHWLVFIVPLLWFVFTGSVWGLGLLLAGVGLRLATAVFTHQRPHDALLQPISTLLMTQIAIKSVQWQKKGVGVWKGRMISRLGD